MCAFVFAATEIQNIQLGDGDVCRNLIIPIYMIFPRLFTCPTMLTESASCRDFPFFVPLVCLDTVVIVFEL